MKKIKKLAMLIAGLWCCMTANAHDFEVDGIYYNILTTAKVEITFKGSSYYEYDNEYTGKVEIPESVTYNGKTYSVEGIVEDAFAGCTGLTSITIPNSVASIGYKAFHNCKNLTSIVIPNSVTSIGDYAFFLCTGLASITIPNSVTSIGSSAFSDCTGLTSITIPNSVTSIGNSAFLGCTGLASITIPNSVTSIGEEAFRYCTELASITIPNSVTSIGSSAFYRCTGLTSITIPNSVTSIGNSAFLGCTGLTSITIPEGVTRIGYDTFDGCKGLKTVINLSSLDISAGSSDHGYVAYYADKVITADRQIGDFFFYNTELARYVGNKSELALPEDCNGEKYMIGGSAFRDNTNLTSVFITASVTGIEENAFNGCRNLASLTMASPVPPASVYENSFGTINYIYTTLYVPEGSLAAYQTADVWKYFLKIKEYDPTGIEDVVLDTESSNLPVYNLQGVRMKDMDNLPSGIYIQGGKKFIVK